MTTNSPEIACECDNDPRLIAGVAAIACHVAKHAAWNSESQDRLADATAKACREAFGLTANGGQKSAAIRVICTPSQDHIQVSIEYTARANEDKRKRDLRVEGVNCTLENGCLRMTITQHDTSGSRLPKG